MNVISKKDLLRGVGSVLEIYPSAASQKRRTRVLKVRKALERTEGPSMDVEQLQGDWQRVGEQLRHAVRAYDQEQSGCCKL